MSTSFTSTETVGFEFHTCAHEKCGVVYGISTGYGDRRRKDGQSFYCPNGHSQSYGKSEADRLRAEKLQLESQLSFARDQRDRMEKKFEHQKIETRTQKGRATRFKNDRDRTLARIANGICPCCNRHFVNVERHMTTKHPGYKLPEEEGAAS